MDALWLELLVALIGEQFGRDSEYICGAVCNMRGKGHKVFLRIFWTIKIFFFRFVFGQRMLKLRRLIDGLGIFSQLNDSLVKWDNV